MDQYAHFKAKLWHATKGRLKAKAWSKEEKTLENVEKDGAINSYNGDNFDHMD